MKEKWKRIVDSFWDFIYPQNIYCICCGNIIDNTRTYGLCDHCITHIKWNLDPPRKIIIPTSHSASVAHSPPCAPALHHAQAPTFTHAQVPPHPIHISLMCCAEYGIYERSIIFALKYNGHKYIARNIGEIMKDRLLAEPSFEIADDLLIVPVPLHEDKFYKRGFNQAELMGKYLSKETGIPMLNALRRDKETRPMRGLGPEERAANIQGSMSLMPRTEDLIQSKKIILVDDFYTTGSTATECSRVLFDAGVKSVTVLAFAAR